MKNIFFLSLTILIELLLLESLSIYLFLSKAEAAGIIQEQILPELASPTAQTKPQLTPDKPTLYNISKPKLDTLGEPYWLNRNICRDNNGNIVCVTSEQAKRLRWIVPSQKR